jgi:hypothetical protein
MAIFPNLELEPVVQVNDRTRLSGLKSFITQDEDPISLVRIRPEAAGSFIDVTSLKYLDWQYATDGTKTVTIEVTTDGSPVTVDKDILIITAADDKLFSSDGDLIGHEPDIMNYVRKGRNSFLDFHRSSQDRILGWLDEQRIHDSNGNRLTKDAVIDIEEVNDWSKFQTLQFIFESLSNAIDDIYMAKARTYKQMAQEARNRAVLRLDTDGDAVISSSEKQDVRSFNLLRR